MAEVERIKSANTADPESGVDSATVDRLCETVEQLRGDNSRLREAVRLLAPKEIPERERWLWENPDALVRVLLGIRDAAEGKLTQLAASRVPLSEGKEP